MTKEVDGSVLEINLSNLFVADKQINIEGLHLRCREPHLYQHQCELMVNYFRFLLTTREILHLNQNSGLDTILGSSIELQ